MSCFVQHDELCYILFRKNCKMEINFLTIFGPFCYVVKIDFLSIEGNNFACCVVIIEFCIFDEVFFAVKFDLIFRKCDNSAQFLQEIDGASQKIRNLGRSVSNVASLREDSIMH